jgi:hypothetical protein
MSSLDKFKKIIKECVREVIQEELKNNPSPVLKEQQSTPKPHFLEPSTTEPVPFNNGTGNPILDILNETKQNMTAEDIKALTENTVPSPTVSNPHTGISEADVPDYTQLMKKIEEKEKQKI